MPTVAPSGSSSRVKPSGRDQRVARRGALGDAGDEQVVGLVGRHVLHRVDGGVDIALDDFLVETPDERPGLAEPVDQFVLNLVAGRLDLHQFNVVAAVLKDLHHRRCLAEGQI